MLTMPQKSTLRSQDKAATARHRLRGNSRFCMGASQPSSLASPWVNSMPQGKAQGSAHRS